MDPKQDAKRRRDQGTIAKLEPAIPVTSHPVYITHPRHAAILDDLLTVLGMSIEEMKEKVKTRTPLDREEKNALVKFGELALKTMKTEVELETKEYGKLTDMSDDELLKLTEDAASILQSAPVDVSSDH